MSLTRTLLAASIAVSGLSACGSDAGVSLSPEAEAGRSVFRDQGCSSCHGSNGQGGVGPSFEGLSGSSVTLEDGSTVTADDAYLRESITDPGAKIVEGYRVPMPTNSLDDDQIDALLDFIRALGEETNS